MELDILLKDFTLQHVLIVAVGLLLALIAWRIVADLVDAASIPSIKVPLTAREFCMASILSLLHPLIIALINQYISQLNRPI